MQDALTSAARTVVSLAEQFDELKRATSDLAARAPVHQRGYFTTTEEEEAQAILVSYWKSRNALFELILSMRQDADQKEADYPEAFLVAFAAALVLVDAARFLREIVEDRPTIRHKLNEPAPQFEIPENVYDSIQRSLLSARHGWHLFHALQYFEANQEVICQLERRDDLAPLAAIIRRLKQRLDISLARFTRAKLRTRAGQIARRTAGNLLGRAMYGLQKLTGGLLADKYVRPGHSPGIPPAIEADFLNLLNPGDVIIVRKEYALTNYFLPGYWPHAALYLGDVSRLAGGRRLAIESSADSQAPTVLEAMKDGVRVRGLASPFASDSVVVIRPQLSAEHVHGGLLRGLRHAGKPYDFGFDFRRSDRLVCTEVVYRAFDGLGQVELPLISRLGRPTLSGGDLIRMAIKARCFDAVAVYAPAWQPQVAIGPGAVRLLELGEGLSPDCS